MLESVGGGAVFHLRIQKDLENGSKMIRIMKKTVLITAVSTTLAFGTVSAEGNIDTVYHVYLGSEKLGTVNSKDVVESIIDEKTKELQEKYPELELGDGNQLKFIPEKMFRPQFNNDSVKEKLASQLSIMAEAVGIVIDDKVIGYVDNEETAEEVIKQLKLKFVTPEVLAAYEAKQAAEKAGEEKAPVAETQEGTVIKEIRFSKEVMTEKGFANPQQILTVEEAVKLLRKGTLEEAKHVVREGEVLGSIAGKYNLQLDQLLQLNPGLTEESLIDIGDELNVTVAKPFIDVIVEVEQKKKETIPFTVKTVEDKSLMKGETKVTQEGVNGEKNVLYNIIQQNGVTVKQTVLNEQVTKEMKEKVVVKGTKVIPSRGTGDLSWPAVGGYISSGYGYRWGRQHKGIDIARPSNRTIKAADNGRVVYAGWDGDYGKKIIVDHNNGYRTVYAHLSSISVSVGQTVSKGSKIGIMGSTGRSTGIHLHFEVYKNGRLQNPMKFL